MIKIQEMFTLAPKLKKSASVTKFFPAIKVNLILQGLKQITLLQSEDPDWFSAREFRFTSSTTNGFLTTIESDYERHVRALGNLLSGKRIVAEVNPVSEDVKAAEARLHVKRSTVLDKFNIQKRKEQAEQTSRNDAPQLANSTSDSLSAMRNKDLLWFLTSLGQFQPSSLKKQQLITTTLGLKRIVEESKVQLHARIEPSTYPEDLVYV